MFAFNKKPTYHNIDKEEYQRLEVLHSTMYDLIKKNFGDGPNLCGAASLQDAYIKDPTLRNIRMIYWDKLNSKVFGIYEFMGRYYTIKDLPIQISPEEGIRVLKHHVVFHVVNALPKFI